jgi:hypothetical protein
MPPNTSACRLPPTLKPARQVDETVNPRKKGGERIDCPEIRVRPLVIFADFSVSGENLDICYDE